MDMTTFDLKALTKEIIHKMGYSNHDLWVIKINDEVFGPFEVESLKHYAHENENMFREAYASRLDHNDWQPFFSHAVFQSIAPHEEQKANRYWILNQGQKAGPFYLQELEKKIELGVLTIVDLISSDDGHSWKKLFQMHEFHLSKNTSENLPEVPSVANFQRANIEVSENINTNEEFSPSEGVASLAFISNSDKQFLKLEEFDLKILQHPPVSPALKWAIPSAVAGLAVVVFIGHTLLSGPSQMAAIVDEESIPISKKSSHKQAAKSSRNNNFTTPSLGHRSVQPDRQPASYNRSRLTQPEPVRENYYPTHVETHQEPEQYADPAMEQEAPQPPEEHSLVNNQYQEGQTLDAAMSEATNPEPANQPPEPVVEEASDF
jgi:hypothetical protein